MTSQRRASALRPRADRVLSECLDQALGFARRRADKHADDPVSDQQWHRLEDAIRTEFDGAVAEWFHMDSDT